MDSRFDELNNLWIELKKSTDSLLISDYDGTLAPFRENRNHAFPYPGVVQWLEKIHQSGTYISLVTGRPISELISLLPLANSFDIWGSHGMEHKKPGKETESFPLDPNVKTCLQEAYNWVKNAGWEDKLDRKHGSLAFHWRGLEPEVIEHRKHTVTEIWTKIIDTKAVDLHEFDGGIELRVSGRDKGSAVNYLIRQAAPKAVIAYLGDDFTDEDGFKAIRGQGFGVLVRPEWRPTKAAYWIKPPEELIRFLEMWAAQLEHHL